MPAVELRRDLGIARDWVLELLNGYGVLSGAHVQVSAGVAGAGTIAVVGVDSVIAVLAFVSAGGAPAAKTLLDVTTDYTVGTDIITCVTDQSLNKLVIVYTTKIA